MRGLRSTIALLVVLVGLGAYIYFVTARRPDEPLAAKQERLFPGLASSKLNELVVKSESGEVTTLKKDGDAWKIVAPLETPAAETDATAIANALADIEIVRVIDETATDVKQYGLDSPQITVDFKSTDGKPPGRIMIGAKTPGGVNLYARSGDQKRVVLIGQFNETTLNKSTFDLRDKTLVKFDRPKVDGADLTTTSAHFEFSKDGGAWKMTKPIAPRTDNDAVEATVARVETVQMKSVVSSAPTPADLKKYGFDKPQMVLNLHMGSARASLIIGGKVDAKDIKTDAKETKPDGPDAEKDAKTVYVRDGSRPDIFTMDGAAADEFQKVVADFRQKEVFDFRAYTASHVELTRNGQTAIFERVKAKDASSPDTWHRVSPNAGDADREKAEQLFAGLADIRATSYVDSKTGNGLDTPTLTVFAKFDEGKKEERVTFGKKGADAFAMRPDDVGAMKIDAAKLDEALKTLDELSK